MQLKNMEKKTDSRVTFQIEVDGATFEAAVFEAYKKNKGSIMVPGFRKGKAPRAVIEGMYGADVFHDDAAQALAQKAFEYGVAEGNVKNVGMPAYTDFSVAEDKALTMTFETDVYPEVELGEYKGIEAEYEEPVVEDAEIDAQLEAERKRRARFVGVERAIENGDSVIFDFEGFVDGVAFDGGKAERHTLEIGSGAFIPGFEDGMVGLMPEADGEVSVTFPEEYHEKSLAGKEAIFKVKIHEVRAVELDALDDEFAKDVSEFDTLADYKADLKDKLVKARSEQAVNDFKTALIVKAAENMKAELPSGMVDEKMEELVRNYAQSMGGAFGSREEMFARLGMDENLFMQLMRPNGEMQARTDVLLDAVAEAEGIEISEEDMEKSFAEIAESVGRSVEEVKNLIDVEGMKLDMLRQRAADLICDNGVKTAPKKAEEAVAEEKED